MSKQEEIHSLREWAQILATNPELRVEFYKMCASQTTQGSTEPVKMWNKWALINAFLKCDRAGKIVSEMYGDKFNNPCNRDKYLAFLQQVNLDDRFGELADLLRKYRAMPVEENVDTQVVEALSGEVSENIIGQIKANIDAQKAAEKPEIIFSTDGELTVYSFVGAPRWWATIREAEEALSVFKAGIAYERERMMKKGDGGLEKMIDDFEDWDGSYSRADLPTSYTTRDIARFFANWERERLMKEAVEVVVYYDFENRLAVTANLPKDSPHKFCDKVKLIILK